MLGIRYDWLAVGVAMVLLVLLGVIVFIMVNVYRGTEAGTLLEVAVVATTATVVALSLLMDDVKRISPTC